MYYNSGMQTKMITSIRITHEGKRIMERLSKEYGISQGAVIELAVRAIADRFMPSILTAPERSKEEAQS